MRIIIALARQRMTVVTLAILCLAVVGCAGGSVFDPDARHFDGLDPAVVAEVLSNPVERSRIERQSSDLQKRLAQVRVINFIMCRDVLRVYQEWLKTGYVSELRDLPAPTYEEEGFYTWDNEYKRIENILATGSIDELRKRLTQQTSCGQGVPYQPGDISGPTIVDVALGRTE